MKDIVQVEIFQNIGRKCIMYFKDNYEVCHDFFYHENGSLAVLYIKSVHFHIHVDISKTKF